MSRVNTRIEFVQFKPDDEGDKHIDATKPLPFLPSELVNEIGSCLKNPMDVANMRMVNKRFNCNLQPAFFKAIANCQVIYPRYESFRDFLSLINSSHVLPIYVRKVVLVTEGLKEHDYGYEWAWEDLGNFEGVDFTDNDMDIINAVNQLHANDITINGAFLTGGGYRSMLSMVLNRLPNLELIGLRALGPDQHNPGWVGPELLKGLSFYRDGLDFKKIFYGDWQYDTIQNRVTIHKDEFGDEVAEDGAGPQATFKDDLVAAIATSGNAAMVDVVWV